MEKKPIPIKLRSEAVEAAKIAASFKGISMMDYASELLLAAANRDIDEAIKERATKTTKSKR